MRRAESLTKPEPLIKVDPVQKVALQQWLTDEVESALSARFEQEKIWREVLRMYEGVPKNPARNIPIENAPNIEVTLGAIATDALYAQALDTLFNISPLVTTRATNEKWVKHNKAFQRFINWVAANEAKIRPAAEDAILDNVKLGTGAYYIPWIDHKKKTGISRVLRRGPLVIAVPPEDLLAPGGANVDMQTARWIGLRFWLTEGEFSERARDREWNADGVIPTGTVGWTRSVRELLGRTTTDRRIGFLFEIFDLYAHFDIDGDGEEEDLLVAWDRSSRTILKVLYNPYDHRPIEHMRYQLRSHLFYGIGAIEMLKPYEDEVTEIHNHRVINMILANARFWIGKEGVIPDDLTFWPNKVINVPNPKEDLIPVQMGDVYPSSVQAQSITISLAERRVGTNELGNARPSQALGGRTPGITTLSLLQQVNRRFTPAFDQIRSTTARALIQCMYRYQERLLAGDRAVEDHIVAILGEKPGRLVIDVLKSSDFDESIAIELTASNASINREQDRQNAIMLTNLLASYYEKTLTLVGIASNPQIPPEVRETARKIANSAGEIIERTIRTFDQVRDPMTFILDIEEGVDGLEGLPQSGLDGIGQLLAGAGAPEGGGPPTDGGGR